jgi:catechol 2,3-dioxygenase-like lactoylglutathione lyase family enzyme
MKVAVPAPDETAAFLQTALDFERVSAGDAEHLTAEGEYGLDTPNRMLSLVAGPELGAAGVIFEVGSESDLAGVRDQLEHLGISQSLLDDDAAGGHGIGFTSPSGVPIECRLPWPAFAGVLAPSDVRPRRLGHVNLKVPDPPSTAAFFCDLLGLRLTEQLGDVLFFVRVNSDHHNVAFRPSETTASVHHVAFEVQGWDSFRVICDHLTERGYGIEYGPGRHRPGHQLFVYVRDPSSGLRLELFTDMAHIDDEETYKPIRREIDRVQSVNMWGPAPPETFMS